MARHQIDVELEARRFLDDYTQAMDVVVALPIPIELVIEAVCGFDVLYDNTDLAPTESGRVDFLQQLITIREDEPEVRQRFSLGHEAGHVYLHRHLLDFFTRPLESLLIEGTRTHLSRRGSQVWFEVEANQFAAAVLMPLHLLRPAFEEAKTHFQTLANRPETLAQLVERTLAERCNVSSEVMRYRLHNTGLYQELFNQRLF